MVVAEVGTSLSVSIISSSFSMQPPITTTKTSFIYLSEYFGTSLHLTVNRALIYRQAVVAQIVKVYINKFQTDIQTDKLKLVVNFIIKLF